MKTEEKIKKFISAYFGIEENEISPSAHFSEDFNIAPSELEEFLLKVGEKLGIDIPYEEAENIKTVRDLVDVIKDRLNEI